MRILIVNDDGIGASQLPALVKWAMQYGEVTVIAPKFEQSGKSHGIEIHKAFSIEKVDLVPGAECYALDSTPADCVRVAVLGMKKPFDLVISGINRGLNVGADIMYSGTVGAVCEAANLGIKAIAFSTSPSYYEHAAQHLDRVYAFIQQHKLLDQCDIYNVNIPDQAGPIHITRQGGPYYSDEFFMENGMVTPHGIDVFRPSSDDTLDTDCVLRCGNISITPLALHRTDYSVFDKLSILNQ